MRYSGQIAIEFLVLLSVSLVAFGAIFFSANQSLTSQVLQNDLASFRHETTQLPVLADRLLFEGDSDWLTFTHLPNADVDRLDVNGKSISFSNGKESWSYSLNRLVETNLDQPLYPSIYLHVNDGVLHIDSLPFLISTPRLSSFLSKGESKTVSFFVRNVSGRTLDFNVTLPLIDSISITSTDLSFDLSPGETKTVTITLLPQPFVSGSFSENLVISFSDHDLFPSPAPILIPFFVLVTDQTYLLFYPSVDALTGESGALSNRVFTICNTSAQTLTDVSFSVSSSLSAIVTPPESFSTLSPGCLDSNWSVLFPAVPQTVSGFVQVQSGSIVNAASLTITSEGGS